MQPFKYLPQVPRDTEWGLSVSTAGHQRIAPGVSYPPKGHEKAYLFDPVKGRVLSEYQLLYIVSGKGMLSTAAAGEMKISAGDMFLLFPGEWHTYRPDPDTGWSEYWIGFIGGNADAKVAGDFFSKKSPVFHVGVHEQVIRLYDEAITIASEQPRHFQQLLAGVVEYLLGIVLVMSEKVNLQKDSMVGRAKLLMEEYAAENIRMADISDKLNISYSTFRRQFRQYTGVTPAVYFLGVKMHRAKTLLALGKSVKEVSFALQFESSDYFSVAFKRVVGQTPTEYRQSVSL